MDQDTSRADNARRHDDSDLIDSMDEPTPNQGGRAGGNLQADVGTQAEEEHRVDGKTGITRVRKEDKINHNDAPTRQE